MKLCRLGIHRYVFVGIFTLRDAFGIDHSFSIDVCEKCVKCQVRYVKPVSPGDSVEWAVKFEEAMRECNG